jgi:hypothetical protein
MLRANSKFKRFQALLLITVFEHKCLNKCELTILMTAVQEMQCLTPNM